MNEEERNRKRIQIIASYAVLPFVLGIAPIIGWYLGSIFDRYFDVSPYAAYVLLAIGLLSGVREAYRMIKKYKDEEI